MAKYVHLFKTESEFNTAYASSSYKEPWVSCVKQNNKIDYNRPAFYVPPIHGGEDEG